MSENEKQSTPVNLKHRLVGAVLLVAAAVIVLPLILHEQEPPPELKASSEAPARENSAEPAPPAVTEYVPPPAPVPDAAAEARPAVATAKEPDTAAAPAATRPAKGWVVQVGVFANAANAAKLADTLKGQGHEVMLDHVTLQNAKRLRLRVGPFADKPRAQQAQAEIRQATGVAGAVLGYP